MGNANAGVAGQKQKKKLDVKGRSLSRFSLMNPNSHWILKPCLQSQKILALRVDPDKVNKTHFIFEKLINNSQYGQVWVAIKLPSQQKMIIKTMQKTEIFKSRSVDSVLNEKALMSQLMHPSIINMKYAFQDETQLYLVSEYYAGGDLSYYLHYKRKRFSEIQAKFIVANILNALEFLHTNSVMHRDISPQNIVFESNGYLRLIDFGYARVWQS